MRSWIRGSLRGPTGRPEGDWNSCPLHQAHQLALGEAGAGTNRSRRAYFNRPGHLPHSLQLGCVLPCPSPSPFCQLLLQPSLGASTDVQLPFAYDKGESIGIQCPGSGYPPHHQISKSICVRCLPPCQLSNTYWSVMNKGLESCEGKGAVRVKEKQCVSFKLD